MLKRLMMVLAGLLLIVNTHAAVAEEDLFDTKSAAALLEKGIDQLKTKNLDAAVEALEESVSIAPEAETYYYLGYAYYMKGRSGDSDSRKKSIESFERAYELDPNFTPSRFKPAENLSREPEKKSEPEDSVTPTVVPANPKLEASQPTPTGAVAKQHGQ